MRIRSITINKLFGMLDHHIPLFPNDPITIIHGPNGIGKTSILRLIYGSLKPAYSHLSQVPFADIRITFDNDTILSVSRLHERAEEEEAPYSGVRRQRPFRRRIRFKLTRHNQVVEDFTHDLSRAEANPRVQTNLEHMLPFLHRVGPWEWHDSTTEEILSFDEVVSRYGEALPDEYRTQGEPDWLRDLRKQTPIHFIETQRLLDIRPPSTYRGRQLPRGAKVNACSEDFANRLKSKLAESATLSQSLERTFPSRLISEEGPPPLPESEIRSALSELDIHRGRLVEAGLLDSGFEPPLPGKQFDETTKRVLTVYIQDTKKKLAIFDDFLDRIELIRSIVNSRFLYKNLTVSREEGFVVSTREGRPVALSDLSSGEQHELVLLYELLFKAEERTFILIDEPELSLHIAWQQQFLRDLLKITHLAKLQALIATHSPQIIHDRWDLTIELTGPAQ